MEKRFLQLKRIVPAKANAQAECPEGKDESLGKAEKLIFEISSNHLRSYLF